jgi:folate-binding protein YgfZ
VEGPDSDIVLERMDIPTPAEPYSTAPWGDSIVARLDTTGAGGYFLIAPAARKKELATRFSKESVPQATAEEARVVRIERGRPRYGEEITERYLVQETGQMHAVSFDKGCYLGQEIVERVRSRAQIHRVLRRVEIESRTPPAPGDQLRSGDADAGEIASAAFSQGLGKTVALAYVRVAFAEPGTQLMLSQSAARVL